MKIALSDDGRDFVRRDWSKLVEADASGTFFHTPRYLKLYWEEFDGDGELLLSFAEQSNSIVGAAAFERAGSTLRFLGGTEVTDYMGPVASPDERDAVAKELLATLASRDDWALADLRGMPEESPWLRSLQEAAVAQGLWAQVEDIDVAPRIDLPGSFDEYLEGLPAKLRHELRRKERKLASDAGGYRIVYSNEGTLTADLDLFVQLHLSSEGPKGKFMQPGMEIFFRRLGEAFLPDDVFRLAFIESKGRRIAGAIGFQFRGTFYLYNSAYDHSWRALSPGMVLVGELIKEAIDGRCRVFDMLKGDLSYKYRFGATPRKLMRLQISRRV
ncbi:MAG: GNAT family N-acetyltransferase [Actinomycetota bacterium]